MQAQGKLHDSVLPGCADVLKRLLDSEMELGRKGFGCDAFEVKLCQLLGAPSAPSFFFYTNLPPSQVACVVLPRRFALFVVVGAVFHLEHAPLP